MLKAAPSPWVSKVTWERHKEINSELTGINVNYILGQDRLQWKKEQKGGLDFLPQVP
jgi:hypothetical protein